MRRCNLACTYCNEFDDFSPPVPIDDMLRRIDKLADLGTSIITISGGEPTLHPELDDITRRIVHLCSQQRGYPNVPIEDYTPEDMRREFERPKTCARYCTIACVQIVGLFDNWRAPQAGDPYVSRRAVDPEPVVPHREPAGEARAAQSTVHSP